MLILEFPREDQGAHRHLETVDQGDGILLAGKLFLSDKEAAMLLNYLVQHKQQTSEKLRIEWDYDQWQLLPA